MTSVAPERVRLSLEADAIGSNVSGDDAGGGAAGTSRMRGGEGAPASAASASLLLLPPPLGLGQEAAGGEAGRGARRRKESVKHSASSKVLQTFFYLLLFFEMACLTLWVSACARHVAVAAAGDERDELASMDALSAAPHFVVVVSLVQIKREMDIHEARYDAYKTSTRKPNWGWAAPPAFATVFDALMLAHIGTFFATDLHLIAAAALSTLDSILATVWILLVVTYCTSLPRVAAAAERYAAPEPPAAEAAFPSPHPPQEETRLGSRFGHKRIGNMML